MIEGHDIDVADGSCASCGTPLAEAAKFCSECGTPVERATQAAEYKQVTVLFADVVHRWTSPLVKRYDGTVDKFTGDSLMAVFGAAIALEDHAVRACLAPLGVQEESKRQAVEVRERDGVDLQVRVGLNSGQVIAGEIGSGAFGDTTIGEQVGMAQRMESVAPPGGVMLSASTAHLVEGVAVLCDPELVQMKGADKPVLTHRDFADRYRAMALSIGFEGHMAIAEAMR